MDKTNRQIRNSDWTVVMNGEVNNERNGVSGEPDLSMPLEEVSIGPIALWVNKENFDIQHYSGSEPYVELNSLLYTRLAWAGYNTILDVGANYGLVSILFARTNPNAKVIALEADPRLVEVIRQNFEVNGVLNTSIQNALVGETDNESQDFSINLGSSLDNRVRGDDWPKMRVPCLSLDKLARTDIKNRKEKVFIKIDAQGHEPAIFRGAAEFLSGHRHWRIKTEFAPYWLRSQGNDPNEFLKYLVDRFSVFEIPGRVGYKASLSRNFGQRQLKEKDVSAFVTYSEQMDRESLGFVDLWLRPKMNLFERLR